jgi:hypothetical protein
MLTIPAKPLVLLAKFVWVHVLPIRLQFACQHHHPRATLWHSRLQQRAFGLPAVPATLVNISETSRSALHSYMLLSFCYQEATAELRPFNKKSSLLTSNIATQFEAHTRLFEPRSGRTMMHGQDEP